MISSHWLFKRFLLIIPALFGISIITFIISANVPGDPVNALVGERSNPELIRRYREKLGVNKPILERYMRYLKMLIKLDLGRSYYSKEKVRDELLQKIPNTLRLAFFSMLFAVTIGLSLGILIAFFENSFFDKLILFFSTLLISLPVFWFAMLLVFIFSFKLGWFPVAGMDGRFAIILPAFTLGSRSLGYLIRLTRSCMLECLSSEYITTVKAKGGKGLLIAKHAFLNAVIPVITFIGLDFGSYMNGSVLTETIFGWDGIGRFAVNGIFQRDYPVIIGSVLFGALMFMTVNILIDILCVFLNPQLRRSGL